MSYIVWVGCGDLGWLDPPPHLAVSSAKLSFETLMQTVVVGDQRRTECVGSTCDRQMCTKIAEG